MSAQALQSEARGKAFVVGAGTNEVWWLDGRVDVKLTAAETEGRMGMWLWHGRQGAAAPLHVHSREDEQFLVLDGRVRFVAGERRIDAAPGDLVFLPRGIPHAYLILSETARLVGTATPGGFEAFFSELGTPVVPGEPEAPPPGLPAMAAASARLGIDILGPPPAVE